MNSDIPSEFEKNMNQLISLLNKLMKNIPSSGQFPQMPHPGKNTDVNVNFFFFNLFPMTEEDMEEWDDVYEHFLNQEEKGETLTSELNPSDIDFLKRHGIRF